MKNLFLDTSMRFKDNIKYDIDNPPECHCGWNPLPCIDGGDCWICIECGEEYDK